MAIGICRRDTVGGEHADLSQQRSRGQLEQVSLAKLHPVAIRGRRGRTAHTDMLGPIALLQPILSCRPERSRRSYIRGMRSDGHGADYPLLGVASKGGRRPQLYV